MLLRWETNTRYYEARTYGDFFDQDALWVTWGGKANAIGQTRCVALGEQIPAKLLAIARQRDRNGYTLAVIRRDGAPSPRAVTAPR